MAYCEKCGSQLNEGAKYCPKCGNPCNSLTNHKSEVKRSKSTPLKQTNNLLRFIITIVLFSAVIGGGWLVWKSMGNSYSLEGLAKVIPTYDDWDIQYHSPRFQDGLARVSKDGKWGFIDMTGKEVIPCTYDDVLNFSEGLAVVIKDEKQGYIDKTGNVVIPFKDIVLSFFHEGLAIVYKDMKNGFIDKTGKEVIPCIYDVAEDFCEGLAKVRKNDKYGYIDKTGKEVVPCRYKDAHSFSEGFAAVNLDGKWGYLDKTGKEVIQCKYASVEDFHEGFALVYNNTSYYDKDYYYINKNGEKVLDLKYESAYDYHEGLARVYNKKYGFIDKTGKEVIPCIYDTAEDFEEYGVAMIERNGKIGYIDKTGKEVIPCIYDVTCGFYEGLAFVIKDNVYGLVDLHGKSTFDIHNEEVNQLIRQKVKEKEEKEREEAKRIEEENKPINRFNSLINQGYIWESRGLGIFKNHHFALYFYPLNKATGKVCLVAFNENYTAYSLRTSGFGNYTIIDDNALDIDIEYIYKQSNWSDRERFLFTIEDSGNKLKRVGESIFKDDCIKKYPQADNPIKKRVQ